MSVDSVLHGLPFNQLYLQRPEPTQESTKARKRIAAYVQDEIDYGTLKKIAQTLRQELAASVDANSIGKYVLGCPQSDFLSAITHIYDDLPPYEQYTTGRPKIEWLSFVSRVFAQESLTFVIDPKGGVHPAPDLEFIAVRISTITALANPRYEAARVFFDRSLTELKSPLTHSTAIRHTFDACENIFKLMFKSCSRLGDTEIEKSLRPQLKQLLAAHDFDASSAMANAFKAWTTAAHQFRHAAGTESPLPASYDLTVLMISTGAAHIRWLVSIDKLMLGKQESQ
jgi:hypothetical protein